MNLSQFPRPAPLLSCWLAAVFMATAHAGESRPGSPSRASLALTPRETREGMTPFLKAAERGDVAAMKSLLAKGADRTAVTKKKWNAVHFAAAGGHPEALAFLLDAGLPVDNHTGAMEGGWATPLFLAVRGGYEKAVALLLARGANPNATATQGWTSLHLAAAKGYRHIVTRLLKAGAKVEATTDHGRTALHWAAANGNTGVVQDLMTGGKANGKAVTPLGKTPLHLAAEGAHLNTVKYLVGVGVPLDVVDRKGETALDLCAPRFVTRWRGVKDPRKHKQVFDFLRAHKAKRGWELRAKSKPGLRKKKRP